MMLLASSLPTDPKWLLTLTHWGLAGVRLAGVSLRPESPMAPARGHDVDLYVLVRRGPRPPGVWEAHSPEKMITYANHLGLYAEQVGRTGEQLGNFPQAFTHLALISAAFNLDRALG